MDEIRLTADLMRDGYTPDEIVRICRGGDLARIRRGAYARPIQPDARPEDEHLRLMMATLPQLQRDAVLSHASAAVVHGLPLRRRTLERVHINRPREGGGTRRGIVEIHTSALADRDITVVHGLRVTSLARTVADLGRTLSLEQAVAAGDRAMALGLDRDDLELVLASQRGWPGIPRARQVARLIDALAESPGESVSRVRCWQAGLPAPLLQYVVSLRGGGTARCDFCWEDHRTLGEFDGKVKYGRLLRPGDDVREVVYREKLREDALRDLGWQVVRWTWSDLWKRDVVPGRLRAAFARAALQAPPRER